VLVYLQPHGWDDGDENVDCPNVPQRIRCAELRFVRCIFGHDLAREVYVKLPEEASKYAGKIVRCVKALSGLTDHFFPGFRESLSERIFSFRENGGRYKKMDTDQFIYIYVDKDENEMILIYYVDDIMCRSNNQELRNRLFQHLNQQWKTTDEGVLNRFVGLNFERSEDGLIWESSCGPYFDKISKRFKVDPKIQKTPMDAGFAMMPQDLREEHSVEEMAAMETEFRSMIGSMTFATVTIRWDIASSVSVLSRYLMKPNRKVIAAARRVIQYLMTMRYLKIRWTSEENKVLANKGTSCGVLQTQAMLPSFLDVCFLRFVIVACSLHSVDDSANCDICTRLHYHANEFTSQRTCRRSWNVISKPVLWASTDRVDRMSDPIDLS
jgi:hypothetical protein